MTERFLQSVENALKVLELFSGDNGELGVSDVSRALDIGRSTAHRLLTTLESRSFVEQNQATGKYRLGMKIVHIGVSILGRINIVAECHPFLETITEETGESSHLSFYSQGEITFIDKVYGKNPATMASMIGMKRPAYCTGTGKSMLAFLPAAELERYLAKVQLQQLTPSTNTNREELRKCLEIVRREGYSEDQQESEEGLVCFAAPVRDRTGKVIAAMSVSGAASRMNARKNELVDKIKSTAYQASLKCGWIPDYEWK